MWDRAPRVATLPASLIRLPLRPARRAEDVTPGTRRAPGRRKNQRLSPLSNSRSLQTAFRTQPLSNPPHTGNSAAQSTRAPVGASAPAARLGQTPPQRRSPLSGRHGPRIESPNPNRISESESRESNLRIESPNRSPNPVQPLSAPGRQACPARASQVGVRGVAPEVQRPDSRIPKTAVSGRSAHTARLAGGF